MMEQLQEQHRRRNVSLLFGITVFNAVAMTFSGIRGLKNFDGALLAEMAHDAGDTGVSAARMETVRRKKNEENMHSFRQVTYSIVSGLGLLAAMKSGYDFLDAIRDYSGWNELSDNIDNVVNGAVIASVNQGSYLLSQHLEGEGDVIHDAKHHAHIDRDASLGLALAVAAGAVVPFVAEVGGVAMGLYTTWHMRPTEQNLSSHHH